MALKQLEIIRDLHNSAVIGLGRSQYVDARVLAAGVAEVHTVPTGAKYVNFSGTTDFYANFGAAAAVPAADVTDGSSSVLNPGMRAIDSATTIGLIASATCIVTMEFWK